MQHDESAGTLWPGYVAAISCLVLSLLLLAAIIVSLITQLGVLASSYREVAAQKTLERKRAEKLAQAYLSYPNVETSKVKHAEAEQRHLNDVKRQLRIVFARDMFDVPLDRRDQVLASITKLNAPPTTKWRVWTHTATGDVLAQRTSFHLISAVRNLMIAHGVSANQIQLQLLTGEDVSTRLHPGEIAVHIAPLSLSERRVTP